MSHLLHHFLWLLRRFRRALLIYLIGWALVITAVWTVPQYLYSANILYSLHGVLAAVAVGLILAVVWQDPAPGTDTFWRTRPPRWRAVWGSQLLFSILCVAGPFVACWLVNGLMLGCTGQQWQRVALDLGVILAVLLAWGGIVSFSRGWYSLLGAGLACYGVYMLGLLFVLLRWEPVNPEMDYEWTLIPQWVVTAGLLQGIAGLLVWGMGLRGHGRLLRGSVLCVILAGGPIALWQVFQPQTPEAPTLELISAEHATESERRTQPAGNLILRGLPAGTAWLPAIGHTVFRYVESDRIRIANMPRSHPGGYPLAGFSYRPPGWQNHNAVLATLPAAPIIDRLGKGTQLHSLRRYYGSSDLPPVPGWYVSWNKDLTAPLTVSGTEQGLLYRLTPLASVPLEEGSSAAERGTRLRVRSVAADGQKLHVLADLHFASGLVSRFLPPEGEPMPSAREPIPVLHFPAGEFAILVSNDRYSDPRSLLTASLRLNLETLLPAAEAIQGRTFTPDLLRGARLHLFSFISDGDATVICRDQVFVPASAPGSGASGEIPTLLAGLTGQRDEAALAAAKQLSTLGPAAARAVLAHDWPTHAGILQEPADYGTDFWKKLLTPDVLPDLTAAMQRDARWIAIAWISGYEDLATAPALEHFKNARGPVERYVLASALRGIQPEDYSLLTRGLPGVSAEGYGVSNGQASILLWQRLRDLPGFDWKTAARTHWGEAWLNDTAHYSTSRPLRAAAALAGEATAFNSLLEDEQAPLDKPGGFLHYNVPAADWELLYAMVAGLPADTAARQEWLRSHRGYFHWDEAARCYRVK